MRVLILDDYDEMSKVACQHLLGHMFNSQNRVNMAITAGATPAKMYELLVKEVSGKDYFDHVHYYNFDEIPYKSAARDGITITDLRSLYFTPAKIKKENIHILDEKNFLRHDKRIAEDGGLDLILLGIGTDGHFCGNLPGTTKFSDHTVEVFCDNTMKELIAKYYDDPAEIPDSYITMGPLSVMNARHIILIANGSHKAAIMKTWFSTNIDEKIPASILKAHPNITVILDKAAAALL